MAKENAGKAAALPKKTANVVKANNKFAANTAKMTNKKTNC